MAFTAPTFPTHDRHNISGSGIAIGAEGTGDAGSLTTTEYIFGAPGNVPPPAALWLPEAGTIATRDQFGNISGYTVDAAGFLSVQRAAIIPSGDDDAGNTWTTTFSYVNCEY